MIPMATDGPFKARLASCSTHVFGTTVGCSCVDVPIAHYAVLRSTKTFHFVSTSSDMRSFLNEPITVQTALYTGLQGTWNGSRD
jgi:hypothetical protein